jgi:hypothetical protein
VGSVRKRAVFFGASFVVWLGCLCVPLVGFALPEGRHYEMVSPPYKAGYGVTALFTGAIEAAAPNDESVAFGSIGAFAGAPAQHVFNAYIAHRDATSGWHTTSLEPPAKEWPLSYNGALDYSASLDLALLVGKKGENRGEAEFGNNITEFLLHQIEAPDLAEYFEVAGEPLETPPHVDVNYEGASAELSHLIILPVPAARLNQAPEGAEVTALRSPYELVSHGGGEHPLKLIGLNNEVSPRPIDPSCDTDIGTALGKRSAFNAIADGGEEIFFTTCTGTSEQLFVRLGGVRTVEVSRPLEAGEFGGCVGESTPNTPGEVPCAGATTRDEAEFVGAAENGSKVFFRTNAVLSQEDTDATSDLYMATIECPGGEAENCEASEKEVKSLVDLTHDRNASAEAAEVQGVVALNPDGSRVYLVARGVLSEGLNAEGHAPVKGADNLYVYDNTSSVRPIPVFIADLCSGPESSGVVADQRCPADLEAGEGTEEKPFSDWHLWGNLAPEAQTTDNGEFLVFSSYGQLVSDDTDNAKDVYRYDAETGKLERISIGEDGYGANGNCDDGLRERQCDAAIEPKRLGLRASIQAGLESRAISEDGSRIVFTSAQALSPAATNGLVNAYEWHEGKVSLVSSGSDEEAVNDVVITPDGTNVLFTTVQGLLPQDTDGARDVYDARLGAGFAIGPAGTQPCSGDACQGPLTNPAPLLVPGSVSQTAGENIVPTTKKATVKKATKKKKKKVKARTKTKVKRASSAHAVKISRRGQR